MPALSAADILHVWEVGRGQPPAERALTVLERACPERDREVLARLPLGARDRLLLEVRAAAIGRALEATAECPACGEWAEFSFTAEDLPGAASDAARSGDERSLSVAGYDLRFRQLDSGDLLAVAKCAELEAARAALIERSVVEARREDIAIAAADLPAEAVAALADRLAEGDPRLETLIDLTCPSCAGRWRAELDLARFVWEELSGQARRLLDDVDALARAYGWSEAEILALSPERRRAYVERVL